MPESIVIIPNRKSGKYRSIVIFFLTVFTVSIFIYDSYNDHQNLFGRTFYFYGLLAILCTPLTLWLSISMYIDYHNSKIKEIEIRDDKISISSLDGSSFYVTGLSIRRRANGIEYIEMKGPDDAAMLPFYFISKEDGVRLRNLCETLNSLGG